MKALKTIAGIILGLFVLYIIISFGWSVLNMQTCSVISSKEEATCEEMAKNNVESCKYLILRWKVNDYEKELQECKEWKQKQEN